MKSTYHWGQAPWVILSGMCNPWGQAPWVIPIGLVQFKLAFQVLLSLAVQFWGNPNILL